MKGSRSAWVFGALLAALACVLWANPAALDAADKPGLTAEDCVKCHAGPPADVAAAGGKHKGVGCVACHTGTLPLHLDGTPSGTITSPFAPTIDESTPEPWAPPPPGYAPPQAAT